MNSGEGSWMEIWRRGATRTADELIWRWVRVSAGRRSREALPVAIPGDLQEGRAVLALVGSSVAGLAAASPALRALRRMYPETRLDVLTTPVAAQIFQREGIADHVFDPLPLPALHRWREFEEVVHRVASGSYDLVFSFDPEGDRRNALLVLRTGARLRVDCGGGPSSGVFNVELRPADPDRYLSERYLRLLGALGVEIGGLDDGWRLPSREKEVAERLLRVKELKNGRPLVAFDPQPGVGGTEARFPAGGFADAVLRHTGARGILLSERGGRELPVPGVTGGEVRDLGLAGPREALGVLSRCDGLVARNTGFFHLAVALGIPAVGIFAPRTPACWRPRDERTTLVLSEDDEPGANTRRAAEFLSARFSMAPSSRGS